MPKKANTPLPLPNKYAHYQRISRLLISFKKHNFTLCFILIYIFDVKSSANSRSNSFSVSKATNQLTLSLVLHARIVRVIRFLSKVLTLYPRIDITTQLCNIPQRVIVMMIMMI